MNTSFVLRAIVLSALLGLGSAKALERYTTAAESALDSTTETIDRALAMLTVDSVWSRIANTHYDSLFSGTDWNAVRAEFRPRATGARTLPELRRALQEMLDRLGESHFGIVPREAVDALSMNQGALVGADAGIEVRLVDDRVVVWRVAPGRPAARAGIRPGWTVQDVNDVPTAARLERLAARPDGERRTARTRLLYQMNAEFTGGEGDTLLITIADDSGTPRQHRLLLQRSDGEALRLPNLPAMMATLHTETFTTPGGCVAVIRFTAWLLPLARSFDSAVEASRECTGIVVDLRGNPGGSPAMIMGAAGHFLNDTLALGVMRTRTTELRLRANPRRVTGSGAPTTPYAGPLAILTDEMTASTSEFFAEGMQGVGRARVFGTRSAGQALPAMMVRLPTGDVLMHVIANYTGPDGSRIEGRGVVPDHAVEPTREDLLRAVDAPLDEAVRWIATATGNTNNRE